MNEEVTRTCSECLDELPLAEFPKDRTKHLGHGYRCRSCDRNRQRAIRDKRNAILGTATTAPQSTINKATMSTDEEMYSPNGGKNPESNILLFQLQTLSATTKRLEGEREALRKELETERQKLYKFEIEKSQTEHKHAMELERIKAEHAQQINVISQNAANSLGSIGGNIVQNIPAIAELIREVRGLMGQKPIASGETPDNTIKGELINWLHAQDEPTLRFAAMVIQSENFEKGLKEYLTQNA